MSSTLRERTVPPPAWCVSRGVWPTPRPPPRAKLVGPDGSQFDIPAELYELLRDVVGALSQGMAISIAPHNTMLTT